MSRISYRRPQSQAFNAGRDRWPPGADGLQEGEFVRGEVGRRGQALVTERQLFAGGLLLLPVARVGCDDVWYLTRINTMVICPCLPGEGGALTEIYLHLGGGTQCRISRP